MTRLVTRSSDKLVFKATSKGKAISTFIHLFFLVKVTSHISFPRRLEIIKVSFNICMSYGHERGPNHVGDTRYMDVI